jgi:hypothetical protein
MTFLVVFGASFVSGMFQWAYILRVRQLLVERHPVVWQRLASRRFHDPFSAAQAFAWTKQGQALDDVELIANINSLRIASVITFSLLAIVFAMIFRNLG